MAYRIIAASAVEDDLETLHPRVREAVLRKIEWLAENAAVIKLRNLPADLEGLCKHRVADYRILYFVDHLAKEIKLLRVQHRSEAYREL